MQRLFSFIAAVICVAVFGAVAFSQGARTKLELVVKDANGAVVPGARVDLTIAGQAIRSGITDSSGAVTLDGLGVGDYKAVVSASGFAVASRDVTVGDSSGTKIEITLSPGQLAENVNVTATRRQVSTEDTAAPVSVLDREQIEQKAVNTIGDVFRTLPGTSTVNEGAFQVRPRIRGLDSNRVLILVDGERLNNSRTSTGQSGVELGLIETSQIESIEVVRGSGSVLYGTDALAGTVNIITRDTPLRNENGFRFGGDLDTFYSSNERGRRGSIAVTGADKFVAFRLAQSLERFKNYSTGDPGAVFLSDFRASGGTINNDGEVLNSQSHGSNTSAVTRFFLNDKNTLRLNYARRREGNIGSPGLLGTFTGYFPFSNRDKFGARFDSVSVNKNIQRVSVSGFYQKQKRDFTNVITVSPVPPFFPGLYQVSETVTDTATHGFDGQVDLLLGKRNTLVVGASYFRDSNTDNRRVVTKSTPASTTQTVSTTKSVPNASLSNFGAFAQNEFRVNNRLRFTGGIRFDTFRTRSSSTTGFSLPNLTASQIEDLGIGALATGLNVTNNSVTGDGGVIFKINHNFSLSGRVGRSFRTPNIFELLFTDRGSVSGSFVVGNSRLKPESGVNLDSTLKFSSKRFFGTLTYFSNSYKNLLATLPATDRAGNAIFVLNSNGTNSTTRVYQTKNIDRARIQGVEAEFEAPFKINLGYLTPNGNFSYLRGDDTQANKPLDFISPLRTNIGIRWNNFGKSYFVDYNMRIANKQTRLSPSFLLPVNQGGNGGPEPGFVTHNVSGGYYFRRNEHYDFNINVGVSNIGNRAFSEQFVFAPARGRSFTIGTTWKIK